MKKQNHVSLCEQLYYECLYEYSILLDEEYTKLLYPKRLFLVLVDILKKEIKRKCRWKNNTHHLNIL